MSDMIKVNKNKSIPKMLYCRINMVLLSRRKV